MNTRILSVLALSLLLAACGETGKTDATDPGGAGGKADSTSDADDWRQRVAEDLATLRKHDPARLDRLLAMEPLQTRAGHERFTTDTVHDPFAASVFINRLDRQAEAVGTRSALAEALPRTGGLYLDAIEDLLRAETDAGVRSVMIAGARRGDREVAHAVLGRGLSDPEPSVRAEAARTIGRRADGAELSAALMGALGDSDPATRAAAARSLGVLRASGAKADLAPRLSDADTEVRLEALRALGRIDAQWLAARPELARLEQDADSRIRRLAARTASR